jgi:hypothetical protein
VAQEKYKRLEIIEEKITYCQVCHMKSKCIAGWIGDEDSPEPRECKVQAERRLSKVVNNNTNLLIELTRRPGHTASAQDMHMQMRNRLPAVYAVI